MEKQITKKRIKTCLILVGLSIFSGLVYSACSAPDKSGMSNENTVAGTAQAAENNQSKSAETPMREKQVDIFAAFEKGDDYKSIVRPQIIKDGWQPARSADGSENCAGGAATKCKEYPELNAGPAAGLGNIIFRWKKADKVLLVFTVDDPPVYDGYEFEKSSKQSSETDVLGKYECCEIGISDERSLELKAKNIAVFNEKDEDITATGSGSWKWDAKKKFISVNLTVRQEFYDSGNNETNTLQVFFQLKKDGSDLKIVNETLSSKNSSGYYIGKTFKKQK